MTSFAHPDYPVQHPGVVRAAKVAEMFKGVANRFDGSRSAATMLLAAAVAALLVVVNQVVDTWTEGHLLMAWVIMWTVTFAAIALMVTPTRLATGVLRAGFSAWQARRKQAAADEALWALARTDARVMADIRYAMVDAAASQDRQRPYY